jgi:hypothetical protein
MPRVIWLRPLCTRYGKNVQRIKGVLVPVSEGCCRVQPKGGTRQAVKAEQIKVVKSAQA